MAPRLMLKPGGRVLARNAPGPVEELIGPLPQGASVVAAPPADLVLLFVRQQADLERELAAAAQAAAGDRLLWIAYPKGGSGVKTDLNRDRIRIWVEGNTELRTVAQVALDTTWSALRLRPLGKVGS